MMFRSLLERKSLIVNSIEYQWNPNKTDDEWKVRIQTRTGVSSNDFNKVIKTGINLKQKEIQSNEVTCLMFLQSKFVLIIKPGFIITVRDAIWSKSFQKDSCKSDWVNEYYIKTKEQMQEFIESIQAEDEFQIFNISRLQENILESTFKKEKCNRCLKVNL